MATTSRTDGVVYFSNFADQRVYRQDGAGEPRPITIDTPAAAVRYADYCLDQTRNRLVCVREDHRNAGAEAVNTIVAVDVANNDECGRVLIEGNDFYSSPRVSPDGTQLAWLTWNHPNMPWDGCELWVGEFGEDGIVDLDAEGRRRRGGVDLSTRMVAGWRAVFRVRQKAGGTCTASRATARSRASCQKKAELGLPQWVFGMSCYAFISPEQIACAHIEQGVSHLRHDRHAHG